MDSGLPVITLFSLLFSSTTPLLSGRRSGLLSAPTGRFAGSIPRVLEISQWLLFSAVGLLFWIWVTSRLFHFHSSAVREEELLNGLLNGLVNLNCHRRRYQELVDKYPEMHSKCIGILFWKRVFFNRVSLSSFHWPVIELKLAKVWFLFYIKFSFKFFSLFKHKRTSWRKGKISNVTWLNRLSITWDWNGVFLTWKFLWGISTLGW